MNKQILLAFGISGLFLFYPQPEVRAGIPLAMGVRGGPDISLEIRPDFIYLDDYGFAVSYGSPYDLLYYDDYYFVYRNGYWYRSRDYRGPWGRMRRDELPPAIGRHSWDDIHRRREIEYRNHDRGFWDNRFRMDRDQWHNRDGQRGPNERRAPEERRVPEEHRGSEGRPGPAGGSEHDRWERK